MARSTSSTRGTTASTTGNQRRRAKRSITNYTFAYQRDDVSHKAGASYLSIAPNGDAVPVTMTLQEAHSLYNFLSKNLNS